MIRRILLAAIALLALVGSAAAQFPGYPASGNLQFGQGSSAPPAWNPLNGDCTATSIGAIVCTKTNGVLFYTGLPTPVNPMDAATKQYVDSVASGIVLHSAVILATTTALPANTYNNGSSGVGATLTSTCVSSCPAPTIDGTAATLGIRVLVKNEAAPANNGLFTVTQVGTGTTPYILTRATDANTAGVGNPNEIGFGTFVLVTAGTANVNTGWSVNSTVATIGTSAINWAQFSSSGGGVVSFGGMVGIITCGGSLICGSGIATVKSFVPPQGRLTLQSGTPVMNTTQAAKATLYYDCFHGGNSVPYYTGSADTVDTIGGCEVSTAMAASSTGVLNNAGVFDVWWEGNTNHNICVATNGSGGGWASDTGGSNTARGTGYSQLDFLTRPYITNKNTVANCYNGATNYGSITANKLTYLGTIYTTAAGQTTWQFAANTSSSIPGIFGVFNAYNRVEVASGVAYAGATSWLYTTATYRSPNGGGGSQVAYVYGINEEGVSATTLATVTVPTGTQCGNAIGLDSSSAPTAIGVVGEIANSNSQGITATMTSAYSGYPGLGLHTLYALEIANAGNCTFGGRSDGGISANLKM